MMLDPDTLVLLQSADAFESMRDHQLARAAAEPEYEEEDIPGPSPRLWSFSSLMPIHLADPGIHREEDTCRGTKVSLSC